MSFCLADASELHGNACEEERICSCRHRTYRLAAARSGLESSISRMFSGGAVGPEQSMSSWIFQAGSAAPKAQDWANMLLRM